MEKEIYINGLKTRYVIKDTGEVYSLKYGKTNKRGKLKACKNKNTGYLCVNLYSNGKLYRKYIHRLVAEYFIENNDKENKIEVNHVDGNKRNNDVSNLEWVTPKENTRHAIKSNLRTVKNGENSSDAKITDEEAHAICKYLEDNNYGIREISEKLGIPSHIINNIKYKKAWTHISSKYDIGNHTIKSKPLKTKKSKPVKITIKDVETICKMLQDTNNSIEKISEITGINKYKINSILYGNAWTKISINFDFSKRRR